MERLLDFSKPIDIALLEQTVSSLNTSPDANIRGTANQVLTALKEHPDSWTNAGRVLEESRDIATQFFALQILEDTIKYRWKALPMDQREGMRNYIVSKVIALSTNADTKQNHSNRMFINKLNLILVHILKQEWPHNWPNFIPEIVASSRTNEVLCENNMRILKLLSEEVFDFSKEEMTTEKVNTLKQQLNQEFCQIFDLCQLVLTRSNSPNLIIVTLQTLDRFLAWIPLGYVFETPLIELLLTKFLPEVTFRNDTLQCLTEISNLEEPKYDQIFLKLFTALMNLLQQQIPPRTDIPREYERAGNREQIFIQDLSLFFCKFFSKHLDLLEKQADQSMTNTAMFYLVNLSMVDDKEIFKICLEFWNKFSRELYENERHKVGFGNQVLNLGSMQLGNSNSKRKDLYREVLSRVRAVMISKMAKPEEVLVVEGDDGTIIRETTKDTDAIAQYKTMRDTLVFLTHLDKADTEGIMLQRLSLQCDESTNEFSWNNLNTLCWAIGSISGAMTEEDEKRFVVTVIKDLLSLCEMKRGKDNKAVVASNIMYTTSQYPRFLRAHWKFLKTVVNKLFEFMHELHPGVQDMACDTFLKITNKCKQQFVIVHPDERMAFIDELLHGFLNIVRDLSPHQRYVFYEACGVMIREQVNESIRNQWLERLMDPSRVQWKSIMGRASENAQFLNELNIIQELADILRVNVRVCTAMGYAFRPHLMGIYLDMLHVYKFYSSNISQSVAQGGDIVIQHKNVKVMRVVKVEILRLIETFVARSEGNPRDIADTFCPPLIEPLLSDYRNSILIARNAEVLQLFTTIIVTLKDLVVNAMDGKLVELIMGAVFNSTLEMITNNFTDYPEHRINFFKLLKALNQYGFPRLFAVDAETQQNIINSIVWAFKHTERNIAETGLEILERLLLQIAQAPPQISQNFYERYYLNLLQEILSVLTDRLHKSGFSMHCMILQQMFGLAQRNHIQVPLRPDVSNNQAFLHQYVGTMIANAFPNVGKNVVEQFVAGLFDLDKSQAAFKVHIRDFLIRLKEFSADDNNEQLFRDEREAEQRRQAAEMQQQRAAVPGLRNEYEVDNEL